MDAFGYTQEDIKFLLTPMVLTGQEAIGSMGGFAVGSRQLIDWLIHRSRPYVFSTATPAAVCGAAWNLNRAKRKP